MCGLKIAFQLSGTTFDFIFVNYGQLRRRGQKCACSIEDAFGTRPKMSFPWSCNRGEWETSPASLPGSQELHHPLRPLLAGSAVI